MTFISSCGSSDSSLPTQVPSPSQLLEAEPVHENSSPSMIFDGVSVKFPDDSDPNLTDISLPDANAEQAINAGLIQPSNSPTGIVAQGNCRYSNTDLAAANGKWKFVLAPDCEIFQVSEDQLQENQAIVLEFDVQNPSPSTAQISAEIIAIDSDAQTVVLESSLIDSQSNDNGWTTNQISVGYGVKNQFAGYKLAVRFTNTSTDAVLALDSISIKVFEQTTADNLVFHDSWADHCNQTWAGQNFWSNRLQDWQILDGRLQTTRPNQYQPNRTTHRISTEMLSVPADFSLMVDTGTIGSASKGSYSGFLIGAGSRMDYRSAALIHNRHGRNGGLIAGIDENGTTFFLDHGLVKQKLAHSAESFENTDSGATLLLTGQFMNTGLYRLMLSAMDSNERISSSTYVDMEPAKLLGNIAIVSNPGEGNTAHWFDNWKGFGAKLHNRPSRQFGPVLFSSYTVDRSSLTVNAQYPPLCADEQPPPTLEVFQQGEWKKMAGAVIDPKSYTARFTITPWEPNANSQYRIVTPTKQESLPDQYFSGVIKYIPPAQDDLVIGLYNCRPGIIKSNEEGWIQQNNATPFTWTRDRIVFPHEELTENSQKHNPDLVAFLGDQIYEFDPNGLVEKKLPDIIFDYLWKWYQFGWSARELMRNTPSFVLPDDHDVFQSNVWGQGGGIAETEQAGGYVYPAEFINIVQKTQTGSLPSPFDATPVEQDISVYYTDLVMGGVGLAILEDRKFKTAPHANQDNPKLLGDRQLEFLEQWAADWEGQSMKIALSQSPFSQSTTHSGENFDLIRWDQDSNGWPKPGRDRAVHHLRKAFAPHLSGDQHLGLALKHGVNEYDDAIYSFAAPSMLNIFPRIWDPLNLSDGPGSKDDSPLGQYTDQHNNLLTVLAVANPEVYYQSSVPEDTPSKNKLGIGYGIARIHTKERRYSFEAWPANVDPLEGGAKPYADWPVTFEQTDNDGRVPEGFLMSRIAAVDEPVVQVFKESTNALEYARRYSTSIIELPVFDRSASYRVVLSHPKTGYREEFTNQRAQ